MKYSVHGIYDDAAHTFLTPLLFDRHPDESLRSFKLAVNAPDSVFYAAPSDFSLIHLFDFDCDSGQISNVDNSLVVRAGSLIDRKKANDVPESV